MSERREFVALAQQPGRNLQALCRQFGISRPTGYKWLRRATTKPFTGEERSRRPHGCPHQTPTAIEELVIQARLTNPTWGGRKLRRWLQDAGHEPLPSASTMTAILGRHGLLSASTRPDGHAWQRFEAEAPNDLWQIDFKGHQPMRQGRLHPLTVLDDHSRFLVGLRACADQRDPTVRQVLTELFRRYGLPWRILTDNGPPWGNSNVDQPWTAMSFWLIRLGIAVAHGRPLHPQTQGKAERFHRTLQNDLLGRRPLPDLDTAQAAFDAWRTVYNLERPHQAIGLATPVSRYSPSPRPYPETLPPIVYGTDDQVVRVYGGGQIAVQGQEVFVTGALLQQWVALRPTARDGVLDVYYCHHRLGFLDLHVPRQHWKVQRTDGRGVNHVPERV